MFSDEEIQCAVETFRQRYNWFRKSLAEGKIKPQDKSSYEEKMKALSGLLEKFSEFERNQIKSTKTNQSSGSSGTDQQQSKGGKPISDVEVLLVDDDSCSREILKTLLEELGLEKIHEEEQGEKGLNALHKEGSRYDLVLCDWNMPGMTGLELLKTIRTEERFKSLPFIMVTGVGDVQNIQEAIQSGVSDYVVKPIDIAVLETKIEKIVNGLRPS